MRGLIVGRVVVFPKFCFAALLGGREREGGFLDVEAEEEEEEEEAEGLAVRERVFGVELSSGMGKSGGEERRARACARVWRGVACSSVSDASFSDSSSSCTSCSCSCFFGCFRFSCFCPWLRALLRTLGFAFTRRLRMVSLGRCILRRGFLGFVSFESFESSEAFVLLVTRFPGAALLPFSPRRRLGAGTSISARSCASSTSSITSARFFPRKLTTRGSVRCFGALSTCTRSRSMRSFMSREIFFFV